MSTKSTRFMSLAIKTTAVTGVLLATILLRDGLGKFAYADEEQLWTLEKVEFTGNRLLSTDVLQSIFAHKAGDQCTADVLGKARAKIWDAYAYRGIPGMVNVDVTILARTKFDRRVAIEFQINERKPFKCGSLNSVDFPRKAWQGAKSVQTWLVYSLAALEAWAAFGR